MIIITIIINLLFLLFNQIQSNIINWNICPLNQQSNFIKECLNFTFPLNRNNILNGNVTG